MTLSEIALLCWNNRRTVSFGCEDTWSENTFKAKWFKENDERSNCWVQKSEASGWYWFEVEMDIQDLTGLQKPNSLPQKACDFGAVSQTNINLFKEEIYYKKSHVQVVIYNGHEKNVLNRVRSHFAVANDKTGALGINHYPLSNKKWDVSVFHKGILNTITCLTGDQKKEIAQFCDSKTGRTAVEAAWRVTHGWPLLCKA